MPAVPSSTRDPRFALVLAIVFAGLGLVTTSWHEMWRDELQPWLLARDNPTPWALIESLRYQAVPFVWHLSLMPLTRLFESPVAMQIWHVALAAAAVFLFAWDAPFSRLQKVLFAFGYYMAYEYAAVARNYAVAVLLLMLVGVLFRSRHRRFIAIGAALFLLANTSVHGVLITLGIGGALFFEYLLNRRQLLGNGVREWQIAGGLALIAAGCLFSVWTMLPPADGGYSAAVTQLWDPDRLTRVLGLPARALLAVPYPGLDFWHTQWLEKIAGFDCWRWMLTLVFAIGAVLVLRRAPVALMSWLFVTLALLVLFYTKDYGGSRHHGLLFIAFLLALWMRRVAAPAPQSSESMPRTADLLLTGLLALQVAGAAIAIDMDRRFVFSYAKAAAQFIAANDLRDYLIVGRPDYTVIPVIGYLGTRRVYYPQGERYGSFVVYDWKRAEPITPEAVAARARALVGVENPGVVLLLNRPLRPWVANRYGAEELAALQGSTIGDEWYFVYRLTP